MENKTIPVKMSRKEAIRTWNNMTPEQKRHFNDMLKKLYGGKLMLTKVNVDDNEQIQSIILDDKDKPGKTDKPFYSHFPVKED